MPKLAAVVEGFCLRSLASCSVCGLRKLRRVKMVTPNKFKWFSTLRRLSSVKGCVSQFSAREI